MKNRKKIFNRIILLAAILLLCLFLRNIDFKEVYAYILQVGWGFVFLLLVTGIGYFLASTAWYFSFRSIKMTHPLSKLFVYRQIGETLALINPTSVIAGDAVKIYFLQKCGIPEDEANSATLISRILLVISLLFILIISSVFFVYTTNFFENSVAAVGFVILFSCPGLSVFYLLISEKMYLSRIATYVLRRFSKSPDLMIDRIHAINSAMVDYFKNHKAKFFLAFVLSALHWISGALEFYFILLLLKIPISLLSAIILEMGVMIVKTAGAFVPGQIGVEEQGNRMMLLVIGVKVSGIWVVVSILRRARQLFWLGVGILFYLVYYKNQRIQKIPT